MEAQCSRVPGPASHGYYAAGARGLASEPGSLIPAGMVANITNDARFCECAVVAELGLCSEDSFPQRAVGVLFSVLWSEVHADAPSPGRCH